MNQYFRHIRSFTRRNGRLTPAQGQALNQLLPQYQITAEQIQHHWTQIYPSLRPLVLEIGFGNGHSLLQTALAHPDIEFLGVEVHGPGVGRLLHELHEQGVKNLRIIQQDVMEILPLLPTQAFTAVHIYFPDPWPKKRHHKRRLIQASLLNAIKRILRGTLHIATDWDDYARHLKELFDEDQSWESLTTPYLQRPMSKYEARGLRLGHRVHEFIYCARTGHP
jgi:tRNA (guanine-N7-)-methyltransferase